MFYISNVNEHKNNKHAKAKFICKLTSCYIESSVVFYNLLTYLHALVD